MHSYPVDTPLGMCSCGSKAKRSKVLLLLRPKLFLLTILAGWQTDFVAPVESSTYSHRRAVELTVQVRTRLPG